MCCGAGGPADRGRDRLAGLARHPALAAAWPGNAAAVSVLRGRSFPIWSREVLKYCRRPRPAVCRRRGQCLQLFAFRGQPGLFQLSVRPCHDRLCAGFCCLRALAAGSPRDGRLCPRDCGDPLVLLAHHPSDVVAGALVGSSARCWCATGLRPAGSASRSSATAPSCPLPGPRRAPQKGCPGRFRPIKAVAASGRHARFRAFQNQPDECRFDYLPTELRSPFPSLCRCATKRTTSRR